jgi:hypothetical protein
MLSLSREGSGSSRVQKRRRRRQDLNAAQTSTLPASQNYSRDPALHTIARRKRTTK